MNSALQSLVERLEPQGKGSRLSSVLLTPRFQRSGHVVALLVSDGVLRYAVKIARSVEYESRLLREAFNLKRAGAMGIPGVPQCVALERCGGAIALVETAVSGIPIDAEFAKKRTDVADGCVSRWVIALHDRSRISSREFAGWFSTLCLDPLAKLRGHCDDEHISRAQEAMSPLKDSGLALVLAHGDLSAPNLLLQPDGECGVIDWEFARQPALPLCDYIFFLAFSLTAKGAKPDAVVDSILHGWGAERVAKMASVLGISRELLPALVVATWTNYLPEMIDDCKATRAHVVDAFVTASRPFAYWTSTVRALARA
jgi:hypothetical protein